MSFLFASPRPSASTSRLLAPVARRMKSNRKRSAPTGSDGGLTIANPERLTKPKQMKVLLLKDLDRFGKEGDIVSANRSHAAALRRAEVGFPIEQTYYGQPSIPSSNAPVARVALHEPSVQAQIGAAVPGFRFFAELPQSKTGKGGVYPGGMPRATSMSRLLDRKEAQEKARRAELVSLGWRPDVNAEEKDESSEASDVLAGWVPGQEELLPGGAD